MEQKLEESKIREVLEKVATDQFGVDKAVLTDDADLINDVGGDSLDMVEFVMNTEEAFNVQISEEEAEMIRKYGDMIALLQKKNEVKPLVINANYK